MLQTSASLQVAKRMSDTWFLTTVFHIDLEKEGGREKNERRGGRKEGGGGRVRERGEGEK